VTQRQDRQDGKDRKEKPAVALFAGFAFPIVLALVFLAFHLPYIPRSLEDLDSINFALGVRDFDVARHQPHPPGYPLYILAAKAIRAVVSSELTALAALSMIAGALGVVAVAALARRIFAHDAPEWSLAATTIAVTSPLYWFTAARPLSDVPGLAAAIGVQVLTLAATTRRQLYLAAFCAGLATGLRSQIAWLTFPLIVAQAFPPPLGMNASELRRGSPKRATSGWIAAMAGLSIASAAGLLIWFIPLVVLTGGPRAYWDALSFQGNADLGNIQMLWTRHGVRDVADALYYAFIAPWARWPIAVAVLLLGIIGLVVMALRSFSALITLAVAFGPYFVFDLLFQETFTSRYALPLVIPMAVLAAAGARVLPRRSGLIAVATIAIVSAHTGGTSVAAFAREKAPAFRLLDDMRTVAEAGRGSPVLAMDRKQSFDFRRPLIWVSGSLPEIAQVLAAPPQHEWLEAVKYWAGGGRAPVWFIVDPKRTMIDLVEHGDPTRYRWSLPHPLLVGGARPDEMDFYRVEAPDWFVGEGWALTPEAAGIADVDRRGPSVAPIDAWVSKRVAGGALMIGGRNFSPQPATISIEAAGALQSRLPPFVAPPGTFVQMFPLTNLDLPADADYIHLRLRSSPGAHVAIEQFDTSSARPIFAYGPGWQEQEFNPQTGRRWRWLSERGELRFASPAPRLTLRLEGENPRTYFSRGSRLKASAGDRVIFDDVLTADFALDLPVPDGTQIVSLETDQVFQPADRGRNSQDRRHLGLRIFKCELRPVS
jgi:hypothetical protein